MSVTPSGRRTQGVSAPVPSGLALFTAVVAGAVSDGGFASTSVWPLTLLGIGLLLYSLIGRSLPMAAAVGGLYGLTFYLVHVQWTSTFLGPVPMVALSTLMALWSLLAAMAITAAYRWLPAVWPGIIGRMVGVPVIVAGLWLLREAVGSVFPYGGFAWGRVALSQVDAPWSPLFAWVGISGVSFLIVLLVAVIIAAIRESVPADESSPRPLPSQPTSRLSVWGRVTSPVLVAVALAVWPAWPTPVTGTMSIAMVQGNGPAGYFNEREPGDLLAAQYEATAPLWGGAGSWDPATSDPPVAVNPDVDLVLWPEGGSDGNPLADPYTELVWTTVTERMDAPLLAQAITERDGEYFNTAILWGLGGGMLDAYDKRHPIPMGEYVPDREFFEALAPDLVGLIQREYTPGTASVRMTVGSVPIAVNICYDISDDAILRESVTTGGRVVISTSNNADFGYTDESLQQLDIARARAIELGRVVANVSTVGVTAVIGPDGHVEQRLPWFTAGAIVTDLDLIDTVTPAVVAGRGIEWSIGLGALAALIVAGFAQPRRRG